MLSSIILRSSSPPLRPISQTYQNISTLPDEILADIFLALKHIAMDSGNRFEPRMLSFFSGVKVPGLGPWIYVSHVCSHWRHVALDTPRLWSTISLSDPARALVMLQRCKDVLLDITCDMDVTPLSILDAATLISSTSRQIQVLELRISVLDLPTISLSISSFPRLQELNIYTLKSYGSDASPPTPLRWPAMPTIRRLQILGFFPNMHFLSLASLVELQTLVEVPSSWLIKVLREAPGLEDVDARIRSHEGSSYTGPSRIHLPKLRSISLILDGLQDIHLFDYLDLPFAAQISVNCHALSHIGAHHISALRRLSFRVTIPTFDTMLQFSSNYFFMALRPSPPTSFQVTSISLTMDTGLATPHTELYSLLPCEATTVLSLEITDESTVAAVIPAILPLFSRIEKLECISPHAFNFLIALVTPVAGQMPNPHLQTLSLTRTDYDERFPSPSLDDFSVLKEVLRERASQGFPIKKVFLRPSNCLPIGFLEELRTYSTVFNG